MPSKHGIWEAPPWRCRIGLTGVTDVDVSAADYTAYVLLLTIANPSSRNFIDDCYVCFDLDTAGTGFGAAGAAETIQLAVARKIDGTNYRIGCNTGGGDDESPTMSCTIASAQRGMGMRVGPIGPNEDAQIWVRLNPETAGDFALPYFVYSRGPAPVITEVAAV